MKISIRQSMVASILISCVVAMSVISCGHRTIEEDCTKEYTVMVDDYASESDMFSIKDILVGYTYKKEYVSRDHMRNEIMVSATVQVLNSTSGSLKLWIDPWASFSGFYRSDTIPLLTDFVGDDDSYGITLNPYEKYEFEIFNSLMSDGGRIFHFEPLFGYKEDYGMDMINVLAEMKVVYTPDFTNLEDSGNACPYYSEPTLIKPSKDIKVILSDVKNCPLEYWWRRKIKKEELPFDSVYKEIERYYGR